MMRTYTHDQVDAMTPAQFDRYCTEIEEADEEWHLAREWQWIGHGAALRRQVSRAEASYLREP